MINLKSVSFAAIVLSFPSPVLAASFNFLSPWQVTDISTTSPTSFGEANASLADPTGVANVSAQVTGKTSGLFEDQEASITFSRRFELADSPQGWNVELNTNLAGNYAVNAPERANFEFYIDYFTLVEGTDINTSSGYLPCYAGCEVSTSNTDTDTLQDGIYEVIGNLSTSVGVSSDSEFETFGTSVGSDFSLGVTLNAEPVESQPSPGTSVPEPSSLFGILAFALWSAGLILKKQHNSKENLATEATQS